MILGGSLLGIFTGYAFSPSDSTDFTSLENSSSSQHRKSGPDEDDAATIAAREFLLGSDMAVQALANSDEDATGVSSAGAKLVEGGNRFPWDEEFTEMALCGNTCATASNGICDEGRLADYSGVPMVGIQVLCDLGSDCADCGPYKFNGSGLDSAFVADSPVKRLASQQVDIRVRATSTQPSFLMAFTDPLLDMDMSGQMASIGAIQMGLAQVWHYRLKKSCQRPDGSRGLVLDVGGNFGWYSLYAAAMGCRVIAWEPVPIFRDFFKYGVAINGFGHLIQVRESVVADTPGDYDLVVPQRGVWGSAGVGNWNLDKSLEIDGNFKHIKVAGERVDSVVHENVALLRIDMEGFEPHVLESARGIFDRHLVDNIMLEYSPGAWEASSKWADYPKLPGMLDFIIQKGYTVLHVPEIYSRAYVEPDKWGSPPPIFKEVTADNLKYDLEDAAKMQTHSMGCYSPKEISDRFPAWSGCGFIPEDLHPKSFRGSFGHNTNVWAVRDRAGMPVGGPTGVFSLDQDLHEWFSQDDKGMGGRICKDLQPNVQVRHRCACSVKEVCGEEALLASFLSKGGRMTPLGMKAVALDIDSDGALATDRSIKG